jgi:hypothetical protein
MNVTRTESYDRGGREPNGQAAATPDEAPTGQLLVGTVGDRCVNCGAPLAADQHYCIHCGERRGKSRFAAPETSGQTVQTTTHVTPPPAQAGPRRPSYGTTLVAGVATLLLAMGVGVEIGRISNNGNNGGSKAAAAPSVITVNGGSASTAATTAAGTQSPASSTHHAHHAAAAPKSEVNKAQQAASAPKPTQQAVKKASQAASSVLGGNTGQSNSTVTTGQSCTSGSAGCQGGHFTGTFFGQ